MLNNKDWKGDTNSVFKCLGANNHCNYDYEKHSFYATDSKAATMLLEIAPYLDNIWENAVGTGNLAKVFEEKNKLNFATDLIDRGYRPELADYGYGSDYDLLKLDTQYKYDGDIVSNPLYELAQPIITNLMDKLETGRYLCMFLKLTFLEGKKRKELFDKYPPKRIWVSRSRIVCAKNGDFEKTKSSAVAYGWFVWQKGYTGDPIIKWFN